MNADRLLDAFNRLGDERDVVRQFRKLVVSLAMSGKLIAADDPGPDAASLLKRIDAEKRALVQKGALRKYSVSAVLSPESLPPGFGEPASFVRLGDLARIEKGQTGIMKAEPGAYPLVVTAEERATCDHFDFDGAAAIVPLVSSAGHGKASLQRLHYQEGKFALGSILAAIFPFAPALVSARFIYEYLTAFKDELLVSQMIGTANVSLSVGKVSEVPIPLVPPSIQRKVDELMGLCDRLEEARAGREAVRDRLVAASLARLNAPDPETFEADARFALDALPALTTRPDQIKALRQTILNLAVRGKVAPQDPNDEPALALVKRMVDERKAIVASRRIRGAEPPAQPTVESAGFELPSRWQLCSLGQITLITDPNPSHRYPDYSGGTVPILSTREFEGDSGWNPETAKLTTRAFWEFQKEICDFAEGDIVFARKGRLGLPRLLPPMAEFTFSHTLFVIKPMTGLDPAYLLWLLRRDEVVAWLTNEMNENTGVPTLGKAKTERLPIPLPPLAEQRRIVVKVDALMALCDQLEASLAASATTRRRLLDALLAEALAPADVRELEAAE